MKLLLKLALFILFTFRLGIAADEYPVYKTPPGSASEDSVYTESELSRGIRLVDNNGLGGLSGTGLKKEDSILFRIVPLAPKHTGLTTIPQPVLLWYISRGWPKKIMFVLNEFGLKKKPTAEFVIWGPSEAGIYQVSLSRRKITLRAGKKYEWSLSAEHKGRVMTAKAKVEYQEPAGELISKSERTQAERMIFAYAESGYWYDAVYEAQNQVSRNPFDPVPAARRNSLLKQIGLNPELKP